jgi:hypothetical protein
MLSKLMRIALRYGLIGGVVAFVLVIIMFYLGRHPLVVSPYLDFRILLFGIFVFFALKEFRDFDQNGVLYFAQAMLGGLIVIFILTTLASILIWIFGSIEPEFVSQYIEQVTAYVKGFSQEDIDRLGKDVYERNLLALPDTNILRLAFTYFVQGLVLGFFVNIVLSVVVRRHPKTT